MSFVFKQIDSSYKTSTPFYAHKRLTTGAVNIADLTSNPPDTTGGEISMSVYYGKYTESMWIGTASEERTTLDEYTRNIWNSVNHVYLDNFQSSPFEKYKQGIVGVETRNVTDEVQVFSIPQKIIGLGIKPGSFQLVKGGYTYIDDGNGNILGYSGAPASKVYNTGSQDLYHCSYFFNEAFRYKGKRNTFYVKSHGNLGATAPWNLDPTQGIAAPVHGPAYLQGKAVNVVGRKNGSAPNLFHLDFHYGTYPASGSAYVRVPHSEKINFDTKEEMSISIWFENSNATPGPVNLISKNGRRRILRQQVNAANAAPGSELNTYISDEEYAGSYPFAVEVNGGTVTFSISDGNAVSSVSAGILGGWNNVTCTKDSASLKIYVNGGGATTAPCGCFGSTKNDADVFMGVRGNLITGSVSQAGGTPSNGTTQFNGKLGPVHIFNKTLTATDVASLYNGNYNNHYGTIQYNHGQVIWTNTQGSNGSSHFRGTDCSFTNMQFRSTKLITTNEFICAVGPGELNMTTNPSILVRSTGYCNPANNNEGTSFANEGGECLSFVTGSDFSPFVTGVGLYNDQGDLLVFGKVATPIKKATNCDTIFIVKWDEV